MGKEKKTQKEPPPPLAVRIIAFLIVMGALALLYYMLFSPSDPNTNEPETYSEVEAYSHIQDRVKTKLLAPSEAEFPSMLDIPDQVTQMDDSTFAVDSWVDSKNAFGTKVRLKFSGVVQFRRNNRVTISGFSLTQGRRRQ